MRHVVLSSHLASGPPTSTRKRTHRVRAGERVPLETRPLARRFGERSGAAAAPPGAAALEITISIRGKASSWQGKDKRFWGSEWFSAPACHAAPASRCFALPSPRCKEDAHLWQALERA